jgi:hypothetical protein
MSSLPGLTRLSMVSVGLLGFAVLFPLPHSSMDHRVKSGGDEVGEVADLFSSDDPVYSSANNQETPCLALPPIWAICSPSAR